MELKDLEIFIEKGLWNAKRGVWDIEKSKQFIFLKINDYIGNMVNKLDEVLKDEDEF